MLDGRFRFDNYVVGSSNRLAVAAARAVAEAPGAVYNPLFIYSGSGLGKTHLIAALGHAAKVVQPDLTVEHVSLDDFVDQLHAAISSGQTDVFKRRYQQIDLLLLDDVQFLTGKRETQNEMLRIFNALQGSGRQIVMASDRPPSEIDDVDQRLLTRLSGGLIVDIGMPEFETRVAILRHKCSERGLAFDASVLEELASFAWTNVRELQGALNRLVAHQSIVDRPIERADVLAIVTGARLSPPGTGAALHDGGSRFNGREPAGRPDEYSSFLSDIAVAVAQHVEGWRVQLGERVVHWTKEGYRTGLFEQALEGTEDPDVDALEGEFTEAVARLRSLEAEAVALDPSLAGDAAFRDPERINDAELALERAIIAHEPLPAPDASLRRETLLTGPSNQLAIRAADEVIEAPGARYNPLYVYGPPGVGKTHLIHAIGNELSDRAGDRPLILCVSAMQFVGELISAIQNGTMERWRTRYRAADVLIVDDVYAFAGKDRSQDELFHLFNLLHASGRQVVFASDRPPSEMTQLEARLRSRFDGGLVVEIKPPDRALREALFARALGQIAPHADEALATYLAERPVSCADEATQLVRRLDEAARVAGAALSISFARRELEGAVTHSTSSAAATLLTPAPSAVTTLPGYFLDAEKVVFDWAALDGRVIEDLR